MLIYVEVSLAGHREKKVMGTRERGGCGGQQEPRSLRAMKAPCTAGSGQGVVTENGKCKSISCCSEENEEAVGKSGT